jgi:hypothetical protein
MPKRRCVFTENVEAECPFSKEDQQVGKVPCFIASHSFQYSMEVVPKYCNISRKENTQLLQKLKVAVKRNVLFYQRNYNR